MPPPRSTEFYFCKCRNSTWKYCLDICSLCSYCIPLSHYLLCGIFGGSKSVHHKSGGQKAEVSICRQNINHASSGPSRGSSNSCLSLVPGGYAQRLDSQERPPNSSSTRLLYMFLIFLYKNICECI